MGARVGARARARVRVRVTGACASPLGSVSAARAAVSAGQG